MPFLPCGSVNIQAGRDSYIHPVFPAADPCEYSAKPVLPSKKKIHCHIPILILSGVNSVDSADSVAKTKQFFF